MKHTVSVVVLSMLLSGPAFGQVEPGLERGRVAVSPKASPSPRDSASPAPPRLYEHNLDFYQFALHRLNPTNFDWGGWYEARRQALLDATTYNPDFWFSLWAVLSLIVTFSALLKSMYDHKRKVHIMGEQMDQVREHDAYSRRRADESIRRYNAHTELCNRVVEAEQGGLAIATGEGSQVAQLQSDLAKARDEIEVLKRDKSRLGAEVTRPAAPSSEPLRRSDSPRNKGNGNGQGQTLPATEVVSIADLVKQINSLQQQLHAEKEKNKHLKGGA
jgi:hypothetical protein